MWSWSTNVTDGQTTCDSKTTLCTVVHHAVNRLHNEANRRIKSDQASYKKRILKSFKRNPKKFYGHIRITKMVKEWVHLISIGNGQSKTLIRKTLNVFIKHTSDYIWSIADHTSVMKDKACLESVEKGNKNGKRLETTLKRLELYSPEIRRLCGDLIERLKILTRKECIDFIIFFRLADISIGLQGHSLKLLKPRCHTTVGQNFFNLCIVNEQKKLSQVVIEATSVNAFKNRLDLHWKDMGIYSWTATQSINNK